METVRESEPERKKEPEPAGPTTAPHIEEPGTAGSGIETGGSRTEVGWNIFL